MDMRGANDLFKIPSAAPEKHSGWAQEELGSTSMPPLVERMERFRDAGLTASMVVREFVEKRIAPLQRHERHVWLYAGPKDVMRLSVSRLSSSVF